ncbi:hypothetical protein ABH944_008410 [Caballeronia udeis]|uniref:Uncharacterized protein n=1 Tax=Caballeronia udeis TaxID=1232866 RepID=A0ABW8MYA4_9BURK
MSFQTKVDTRQRTQEEIDRDTPVTVTATMLPEVAEQLAQFAKRSLFDTFYEMTEAHLPHEERQRRASLMITGIEAVASGLRDAGYSPR